MTDREMVEKAAKAVDLPVTWSEYRGFVAQGYVWNPLTRSEDAFELMVKLRLTVFVWDEGDQASAAKSLPNGEDPDPSSKEWHADFAQEDGDLAAATRRAITRAAAAIQEAKEGV